jgi:hypothetical protein
MLTMAHPPMSSDERGKRLIEIVLQIKGTLSVDGFLVINEHAELISDSVVAQINLACGSGVLVDKEQIEAALRRQ